MHDRISLVVLALALVASAAGDSKRLRVAVNDLQPNGIELSSAQVISDRIRAEMVNTGLFSVMERGEMESILKEQGFQQTGMCNDQQCLVEVGQLLGVDRMIAGSIGKVGTLFTISLRAVSIETGEILYTVNEDCQCPIENVVSASTRNVVQKLVQKVWERRGGDTKDQFATVSVTSDPKGADVLLNEMKRGVTPARIEDVLPGSYKLKVQLADYEAVEESINAQVGTMVSKDYRLKYTQAYLDSQKAAGRAAGRKGRNIRKVVFGLLAAGSGVAGFLFENQANGAYKTYGDYHGRDPGSHDANWKAVQEATSRRNVMYGAAGVCALGFGISFIL